MKSLCSGSAFSNAVLSINTASGVDFYRLQVSPVHTILLQPECPAATATEKAAFGFDRIELDYVRLGASGAPQESAGMTWDLALNTGSGYGSAVFIASLSYKAGGTFATLSWPSVPGKTYTVLFADQPEGAFSSFGSYSAGQDTRMSIQVPVDRMSRFFRVMQQ